MAHLGPPTAQASPGPRTPAQNERQEQKRDLASWWKNFKRSDKKPQEPQVPQGIFGVPLQHSIRYANVAISLINDQGHSYIYGYVPIVVAKCGVFLKEKATETEGIFRLAGSEKRIKELRVAFDSPDRFGKGLDWTGYTVHDAANILRRYFNQLPEPIIPLDFYERFRNPLRNHQAQAVGQIEAQSPSVGHFDPPATISVFQKLITELPPLNRQLLLYILDLLAVFASKSDVNKMTTPNLAAIFQPGILSHPNHDMAPQEYRLSQDVLIFLIENQDSFLIGMQGTEADPQTVRDVQSGTPPPPPKAAPGSPSTPGRSKTIVGRSASNASTRAESLRKTTDLRRNASVSSKQSKRSENGPTAANAGMSPSGSVHRSNTVPSRRDGSSAHSPRITREKVSEEATESPMIVVDSAKSRQESLQATPVAMAAPQFPPAAPAAVATAVSGAFITGEVAGEYEPPRKDVPALAPPSSEGRAQSTERVATQTPSTSPGRFLDIFKQSPNEDTRKPNKLQKKQRIPSAALSSAHSSTHSLGNEEHPNGTPQSMVPVAAATVVPADVQDLSGSAVSGLSPHAHGVEPHPTMTGVSGIAAPVPVEPSRNLSADHGLRPTISPSPSYQSATESDAEMVGDDMPKDSSSPQEKDKRRHRWRFSRSQNKLDTSPAPSPNPLGTLNAQEQTTSRSTVGSNGGRKSFQDPTPLISSNTDPVTGNLAQGQTFSSSSTDPAVFSDSEREKKGPMSWIRGKMGGNKDKDMEKRQRTPSRGRELGERPADLQTPLSDASAVRGKSFEVQRNNSQSTPIPPSTPVAPITTSATPSHGAVVAAQVATGTSPSVGGVEASPPATFSTPPTSSHGFAASETPPATNHAATSE